LEDIRAIDEPESAVNSAVVAVGDCCMSSKLSVLFICLTADMQIIQLHVNTTKVGSSCHSMHYSMLY